MGDQISLSVTRYRDKGGLPTCAADFSKDEFCWFVQSVSFGNKLKCSLPEMIDGPPLERRGADGLGCTIPAKKCPVWKENGK